MHKIILIILAIVILFLSANLIFHKALKVGLKVPREDDMKLTTVFKHNEKIPSVYTCDGEDLAPELTISDVPAETKELVLIVDDPDAPMGTWVHWLVYNMPATTTKIDAKNLPTGAKEGMTDFGKRGWGGPCPPSGTHRYFFKLYALDKTLDLQTGLTKAQLERAIKNHVIEKDELIGLYKRN